MELVVGALVVVGTTRACDVARVVGTTEADGAALALTGGATETLGAALSLADAVGCGTFS